MPPLSLAKRGALALALGLSASCASRELPSRFPETSPASVEAHAGRTATVTRSLDADPGQAAQAEPHSPHEPAAPRNPHEGHHGHH